MFFLHQLLLVTLLVLFLKCILIIFKNIQLASEEETENLNDRFQKVIIISNSVSTEKEGVAFILNKEIVNGMKWNHSTIIEGRASRLELEMRRERGLNIILIYTPNGDKDKIEFWNKLNKNRKPRKHYNNGRL